jgi:hypothetical protein
MDYLESSKEVEACTLVGKPVYIIFKDNVRIGYTMTEKEADVMCDRDPSLQWDKSKKQEWMKTLPLVIA